MARDWVAQLLDAGLITEAQRSASEGDGEERSSRDVMRELIAQGLDERRLAGFFVTLGFGPVLQSRELARADEALVRQLPGSDAHELCALPLRPSPAGAVVAMADPTDARAVQRLTELLGGTILPTVARLSDLVESLHAAYPGDRPTLVSDPLSMTQDRHPSGVVPLVQEKPGQEEEASPTDRTLPSLHPQLAGLEHTASPVWDRAWDLSTGAVSTPEPLPVSAPKESEAQAPDLEELTRVTTRDDVVRVGCDACLTVAGGAAFLALRKGVFRGWDGAGEGITSAGVRSLWVPATNPSVLNDVAHSGQTFRGPHGQTAADHLLRAALGGHGQEVLIVPVLIGTRMCGLLCATDPGPDSRPIERVAEGIGQAFQRLIVSQKTESKRPS